MRHIEFVEEPGRIDDLVVLFISHFNREFFQSDNVVGKLTEFEELCSRLPEIPEELRIFFHVSEHRRALVQYGFDYKEKKTYIFGKYTAESLSDIPKDCEYAKRRMICHYFPELEEAEAQECADSVAAVSRVIRESGYSDSIKSGLYAFFIEPEAILRLLAEELSAKDAVLRQEYARLAEKLAELRADFDFQWVIESIFPQEHAKALLEDDRDVFVTFMLYDTAERVWRASPVGCWLALGSGYRELLAARRCRVSVPKLQDFGQAVSDPNRVAILELARERGQVTVRDVEQVIGLSGTNVYYHLTLLQKMGLLCRGSRGKTAYFSLDTVYFQGLCKELEAFTKLPEPKKE